MTITFRGGGIRYDDPNPPSADYDPPVNTLDPRYAACTAHHVACDCREAEFAEHRAEERKHYDELFKICERLLTDHPTEPNDDGSGGCMCTGCQIVRAAHLPYYRWIR